MSEILIDAEILAMHAQMFADALKNKHISGITTEQFLYFIRREIMNQEPEVYLKIHTAE